MFNIQVKSDIDINWVKLKQGDKVAFELIYKENVQALFRYGMSFTREESDVLDAIQDIFTDIWQKRERLSDTDNVKFYLLKSLKNRILRNSTINNRLQGLDYEKELSNVEDVVETDDVDSQTLHNQLNNIIDKLPERQNKVVKLRYFENLSLNQISTQLGINLQSTKNLLYRSIQTLKKEIGINQ